MLDPTSLPLSADLRARLTEWGQEYALLGAGRWGRG